ncbi:MAG: cytochrome c oxidase subunit 2A [Chloroflexi bacterium SZAS-1]|jgi:hypothetical protein|nr:cytochrome c oxidase subunit 2A [Chloroflexi bacterium SZAS-1]HNP86862.1 cytochrome c oxidase subunit 2A [Kouleothrix sp.]
MSQVEKQKTRGDVGLEDHGDHGANPNGTLAIMLIYLLLIIVLWGSMFLVMLERS